MLEVVRPEARAHARTQPQRFTWGTVDIILAVAMLPFALWMLLIDRMVAAIAWLLSR